jgi:hypothetical protein
VAKLWRAEDGDLAAFVREAFIADPALLDASFARLEQVFEQIDGHIHEVGREVRRASDVDVGRCCRVDPLLAAVRPGGAPDRGSVRGQGGVRGAAQLPADDAGGARRAGAGYTRRQWAEARLAGRFARRVPGEVRQAAAQASAEADRYISQYNLWMHHLVDADG